MKFYVTAYALTSGILLVDGELCESSTLGKNFIKYKRDGWTACAHGNDFYADRASAVRRAEEMRQKKMVSLKKKLKQLETMIIEVVDCP